MTSVSLEHVWTSRAAVLTSNGWDYDAGTIYQESVKDGIDAILEVMPRADWPNSPPTLQTLFHVYDDASNHTSRPAFDDPAEYSGPWAYRQSIKAGTNFDINNTLQFMLKCMTWRTRCNTGGTVASMITVYDADYARAAELAAVFNVPVASIISNALTYGLHGRTRASAFFPTPSPYVNGFNGGLVTMVPLDS